MRQKTKTGVGKVKEKQRRLKTLIEAKTGRETDGVRAGGILVLTTYFQGRVSRLLKLERSSIIT